MKKKIPQSEVLTTKQDMFIKAKAKGMNNKDSAIMAGYAPLSASTQASRLMKKDKITNALDTVGLTDTAIARGIKTNIEAGMGIKATADTSLKGLALASKLKGHGVQENKPTSLSQTNVYIEEVKQLSDSELNAKLDSITSEVSKLKTPLDTT